MSLSWSKETDTWVRTPYTPEQETFWRERAFFDARCNEASALHHARSLSAVELAKKMMNNYYSVDNIITATGLTRAEVEGLQNTN